MKCYVINLDRATERRKTMISQFAKAGIEFEFAKGIDWCDLSDQDIQDNVCPKYLANQRKWKRPLVHGGLACWLSHRKVWQTALQNNESIIAVFEDDCSLAEETQSVIDNLDRSVGMFDFDIVFLYNGKTRNPIIPVYRLNEEFILGVIRYDSIGAVGYVITAEAMKSLLSHFPLMNEVVDTVMHSWWMNGLKTYMLSPQVVFHGTTTTPTQTPTGLRYVRSRHHSFGDEPFDNHYIKQMGYQNLRHGKNKMLGQKLHILLSQGIPKRLAFRKRMKNEPSMPA